LRSHRISLRRLMISSRWLFFGVHQDVFFELVDPRLDPVADEEVVVHDPVDQMVEEDVRPVDLFFQQNRLHRPQLVDFLPRDGNDVMPSEKNVQRPQKNFLVVETDAVDDDEIMPFVHFQLRPLLFLAETVLHFEIVESEQRLQRGQLIDVGVDPVEAFARRIHRFAYVFDQREDAFAHQSRFHTARSFPQIAASRRNAVCRRSARKKRQSATDASGRPSRAADADPAASQGYCASRMSGPSLPIPPIPPPSRAYFPGHHSSGMSILV